MTDRPDFDAIGGGARALAWVDEDTLQPLQLDDRVHAVAMSPSFYAAE